MRTFLLGVLLTTCAPEAVNPEIHASILPSVGEVLHPGQTYVRFDAEKHELVFFEKLEGRELGRGSVAEGTRTPVTLEGRACEIESRGTRTETETLEANTDPAHAPRNPGVRTRTTTVAKVTLRCADGPAPGIVAPPSVEGWKAVGWVLPLLLAGLLIGVRFTRGGDTGQLLGLALGALTTLAFLVFSWRSVDGLLVLTLPLLGLAVGAAAFLAVLLWTEQKDTRSRVAAALFVLGGAAGPALIAKAYPLWAAGAPLAAAGVVVAVFATAGAVAVSGPSK